MFNYIKKKNKQELTVVLSLFAIFLLISVIAFDDFGISVDEWELRILGFSNLKYIISLFSLSKANELNNIMQIPELSDYLGTHGAIFALPMSFIEYIFNIKDSQTYFFLRQVYLNIKIVKRFVKPFYMLVNFEYFMAKCSCHIKNAIPVFKASISEMNFCFTFRNKLSIHVCYSF